jgi:HK97 gp10 family phage protein
MPLPKSQMKIKKDGVEFISNVDAVNYTIAELTRAALRDVAKLIRKRVIAKMKQLRGLQRSRRPYRAFGYWVRKKEGDLQMGFGNTKQGTSGDAWYAIQQEVGSKNQPKRGIMRETVFENIEEIRKIQAQYLSAITTNSAQSLIDENEQFNAEGDE